MTQLRPRLCCSALLTLLAMLAPNSRAQITTGADRYMGSTQGSLSRTNAAIGSMTPNDVPPEGAVRG